MPNQAASSFLAGEIFLAPFSQSDLAGLLLLGEWQLPEEKEESFAFIWFWMTLLVLEPPHGAVREIQANSLSTCRPLDKLKQ